jgi:hypothetical protein
MLNLSDGRGGTFVVIAGLDPAIHPLRKSLSRRMMDARVKPGHDDRVKSDNGFSA